MQGIPSQFDIIFDILGSVNEINLSVDLLGNSGTAVVDGDFAMGTEPYPGRLAGESNYGVFSISSGPVSSKTAKTLFNRFNDSAVSITGSALDACIYHNPGTPADQYKFTSDAGSAALLLKTKVYTDVIYA